VNSVRKLEKRVGESLGDLLSGKRERTGLLNGRIGKRGEKECDEQPSA